MKILKMLMMLLAIAAIMWVVLSYCQVMSHNLDAMFGGEPYTYPAYNFFIWLTNLAK